MGCPVKIATWIQQRQWQQLPPAVTQALPPVTQTLPTVTLPPVTQPPPPVTQTLLHVTQSLSPEVTRQRLFTTQQQHEIIVRRDETNGTRKPDNSDVITENDASNNATTTQSTTPVNRDVNVTYYITVSPVVHRLGNQMFQYAALQGLARLTHHTPIIVCSSILTESYPFIAANCVPPNKLWEYLAPGNKITLNATLCCTYMTSLVKQAKQATEQHIALSGYLQSWKYLQNVSTILQKHFQFDSEVTHYAKEYLLSMIKQYKQNANVTGDVTPIGVHVRRGDFLSRAINELGILPAPRDYFHTAMDYFRAKYCIETHCVFILASDDVAWCRENLLADDVIIIADHKTAVISSSHINDVQRDMGVLRLVKHSIISTGTFGWWIGWFTPGRVVYCKDYARKGSLFESHLNSEDYFLPGWIGF